MLYVLVRTDPVSCTCSLYPGFSCACAQMQWILLLPLLRASRCLFPLQCQKHRLILLGLATDRETLRKHRCVDRNSHIKLLWYLLLLWLLLILLQPLSPQSFVWPPPSSILLPPHPLASTWLAQTSASSPFCWMVIGILHPLVSAPNPLTLHSSIFQHLLFQMGS